MGRNGSGDIIATDIWDGNIGGLKARIVKDPAHPNQFPQKYFYHYDGLGNVVAITDESQRNYVGLGQFNSYHSYSYDSVDGYWVYLWGDSQNPFARDRLSGAIAKYVTLPVQYNFHLHFDTQGNLLSLSATYTLFPAFELYTYRGSTTNVHGDMMAMDWELAQKALIPQLRLRRVLDSNEKDIHIFHLPYCLDLYEYDLSYSDYNSIYWLI